MVPYGLENKIYNKHKLLIDSLSANMEIDERSLIKSIVYQLEYSVGKYIHNITEQDIYLALGYTIRDILVDRYNSTQQKFRATSAKRIYYMSMEFLIGRSLQANLINLGIYDIVAKVIESLGYKLEDIFVHEPDAGLGNGGLGRLAACFLDSMATMELPCYGSGLRYEFGLFEQKLENGFQIELPDNWMANDNPWEIHRRSHSYKINFYGSSSSYLSDTGDRRFKWNPGEVIIATAYDMMVAGFNSNTVNRLRLWTATASSEFNLDYFNHGDYIKAMQDKLKTESITKVLYPNDDTLQGSELRLKQEYLLVSATLQDALAAFQREESSWLKLPERIGFQLNDTHPATAVAELMRLLMDEHAVAWDLAWQLTQKTISFTNHTVMPEALEKWDVNLFGRLLPRILEIIERINFEFLDLMKQAGFSTEELGKMSIFEEGKNKRVRMANLAVIGSHTVNGVAAIHSGLVKKDLFPSFTSHNPEKFQNKTNGVTPRRWIYQANPELSRLITKKIGNGWITKLEELRQLEPLIDDDEFLNDWAEVKENNKRILARNIQHNCGITIDTNSIFDVQVKRIHEYKRQLLNVLRIIHDYQSLLEQPEDDYHPRTFIFAGKAAPGYFRAKLIIKLITAIANKINNDKRMNDRIKVAFLPNFSVTLGEIIYPGTDLSEQISTAGTEASGTGNMKFMMNGALTVGTLDGANIEIREEVGEENIFIFGHTLESLDSIKENYVSEKMYNADQRIKRAIDAINDNLFSPDTPGLFDELTNSLVKDGDQYYLLADFDSYLKVQNQIQKEFIDQQSWTRKSILNTARSGKFSSDRTIYEYARDIWKIIP